MFLVRSTSIIEDNHGNHRNSRCENRKIRNMLGNGPCERACGGQPNGSVRVTKVGECLACESEAQAVLQGRE